MSPRNIKDLLKMRVKLFAFDGFSMQLRAFEIKRIIRAIKILYPSSSMEVKLEIRANRPIMRVVLM